MSAGEGALLIQTAVLALGASGAVLCSARRRAVPEHRRVAIALVAGAAGGGVVAGIDAAAPGASPIVFVYAACLAAACVLAWLSPFLDTYQRYKRRKRIRRRAVADVPIQPLSEQGNDE
jgi:hypothetical protein